MQADQITLPQIRDMGYAAYARTHVLPDDVRRAVWAILAGRTALLGGHVQACPEGHLERSWYNSCRHRLCPQGAGLQIERWLARQKRRLLACEHDHGIFTRPPELNALGLANVEGLSGRLCASVHDTLGELLGDAQYRGARPGMITTLHTWSQTVLLHPHLPCLVTGGGLNQAGQWVAVRHSVLLPRRVVRALFRGNRVAAIRQGLQHGQLTPPRGQRRQQVENLLNQRGRQKWHVHLRARYPEGQGVLIDLARSLRGGPIANRRLRSWEGPQVTCSYEERPKGPGGHGRRQTMRLPIEPCIGRWLLQVPPPHAVRVRAGGL